MGSVRAETEAHPVERWFANTFSFIPFFGGGAVDRPRNYFIAGLILAIMILPIVSAISREVMATVPSENKEAALALGATRWEMIRISVLPYARPGITGGAMLGLGRAIGETIAVVLVIGNAPTIGHHIFDQGYSLAAVIANEFGEAANQPLHRSALFAAGLVLFVLTLMINILARWFVARGTRAGAPAAATSAPRRRDRRDPMSTRRAPEISPRRRRTDKVMRASLLGGDDHRADSARADHLLPPVQGRKASTGGFFTTDPNGNFFGNPGGFAARSSARSRSSALATVISIPIGICVALYLIEYGKHHCSRTSCATSST